jgi:hypothetical protein
MFRYIKIVLLILLITSQVACKKYLETKPNDFISPENYYNTESEATSALLGLYTAFNDNGSGLYGGTLSSWVVVPTDEVYRNSNSGINCLSYDATDVTISNYWNQCYRYINNCNYFLENIDKPNMDKSRREVYRAEALFLRAYIYFLLTSQFGDVPLKLSSTQSVYGVNIPFTASKDIYNQILKDMTTAESKVYDVDPSKQQPMRVSKQVVRGILARVNLYMAGYPLLDVARYQDARDWAKKVVDDNKNNLLSDYTQLWINIAKDAYYLPENMWEAEFQVSQQPFFRASGWGGQAGIGIACPSTNNEVGYVLDWYKVTYSLSERYRTDTADVRYNWNIASFYYRGSSGTFETSRDSLNSTQAQRLQKVIDKNPGKLRRKYEVVRPANGTSGMNFPILRYADVLLMYAEAENELNGPTTTAINLLNLTRVRAGCTKFYSDNTTGYFAITDQASFVKAIQDERSRELCFEYVRRNDLIRWGIYQQTLLAEGDKFTSNKYQTGMSLVYGRITEKYNLLPIPMSEISLNNLAKQNIGW